MFGPLGLPALGLPAPGSRPRSPRLHVPRARRRRRRSTAASGAFACSGASGVPDWPRYRAFWRLGLPIGVTLAFEVTIFNARRLPDGPVRRRRRSPPTRSRIQIASLTFMVPLGIGQAATVRVGRAYGAGDRGRHRAAPAGRRIALGVGFMALTALLMLLAPQLLVGPFLDARRARRTPRSSRSRCPSCSLPRSSRLPTARRRSAPACCAGSAIPGCR